VYDSFRFFFCVSFRSNVLTCRDGYPFLQNRGELQGATVSWYSTVQEAIGREVVKKQVRA
jgi:hypothetical protein